MIDQEALDEGEIVDDDDDDDDEYEEYEEEEDEEEEDDDEKEEGEIDFKKVCWLTQLLRVKSLLSNHLFRAHVHDSHLPTLKKTQAHCILTERILTITKRTVELLSL